jgi:hypothetical protein
MLQGLVTTATQLLSDLQHSLIVRSALPRSSEGSVTDTCIRLDRLLLTDGVGRSLFAGYEQHRQQPGASTETGWLLMGLRESSHAVALATLPAGMLSDAGAEHIRFNSLAQAVGSRIVRQRDRRLTVVGVVHTHPGSLRHPSDRDLRGDRIWVGGLRSREGVFGIGTADGKGNSNTLFGSQPKPNMQCLGKLRFSWYSLREGDSAYRPLAVELTIGPDLAQDLHFVWATLEAHAERIERLMQQQVNVRVEVVVDQQGPTLVLIVPLARKSGSLRVLVRESQVQYLLERNGEVHDTHHHDDLVDRGVYLLLARLAEKD